MRFSNNTSLVVVILIVATGIFAAGTRSLPMDGHEVFVVQTAQEMHDRNDWIVPWFNDEPRLNKPPLNYWLTELFAIVTGYEDNMQAWHGRLVSIIAALLMIVLTYHLAKKLYSKETAIVATAMMATSSGLFTYSHDARPDMLYAVLCTAGFTAFVYSWYSNERLQKSLLIYLMWFFYALATLCKGPHMPGIYLAASIAFCIGQKYSFSRQFKLFRPVSGLLLFTIITLPWWYALNLKLGGSTLADSQLGGSLLTINFSSIFRFYYFYRPIILALPWLIFLPITIIYYIRGKDYAASNRLLGFYLVFPAVILELGSQERWFYFLPSLAPIIILVAASVVWASLQARDSRIFQSHRIIIPALVLAPLSIMIVILSSEDISLVLSLRILIYLLIPAMFILMVYLARIKTNLQKQVLVCSSAIAIGYMLMGTTHLGWSQDREAYYQMTLEVKALRGNGIPFMTLGIDPNIYVYYSGKGIIQAEDFNQIFATFMDMDEKQLAMAVRTFYLEDIPAKLPYKILDQTSTDDQTSISLIMITKK